MLNKRFYLFSLSLKMHYFYPHISNDQRKIKIIKFRLFSNNVYRMVLNIKKVIYFRIFFNTDFLSTTVRFSQIWTKIHFVELNVCNKKIYIENKLRYLVNEIVCRKNYKERIFKTYFCFICINLNPTRPCIFKIMIKIMLCNSTNSATHYNSNEKNIYFVIV